jgi:hypothetical protein
MIATQHLRTVTEAPPKLAQEQHYEAALMCVLVLFHNPAASQPCTSTTSEAGNLLHPQSPAISSSPSGPIPDRGILRANGCLSRVETPPPPRAATSVWGAAAGVMVRDGLRMKFLHCVFLVLLEHPR